MINPKKITMKKTTIAIVTLCILAASACKKTATVSGGTWSFKSKTYNVTSAIPNSNIDNSMVAISASGSDYSQLQFFFNTLPTASGQYTVTTGAPDTTGTQMGVYMSLKSGANYTGPEYSPTVGGVTATVTITNGSMKISMPLVDMTNVADTSDHASLSATVNQTQ